jgi:transposase
MDFLYEHVDEVEESVFFRTANLFNLEVDLIFYDTTTAEFSVSYEDEEESLEEGGSDSSEPLRRWGRDKSGGHSVQVVIALAVTKEGLPVRSWVFPGNTTDSTTIERVRADLRAWKLGRCILVGDAGMNSEANRAELARGAGKYILATRLDGAEVRDEVLSRRGRYRKLSENLYVKEVVVGEGERRRRYALCYNPHEAKRQKARRDEVVTWLHGELARHSSRNVRAKWTVGLRNSARTGPYLSVDDSGELYVDMQKVRAAGRLDGKWVVLTNDDTLAVDEVATSYKAMSIIERCFLAMKSGQIEIDPMFHRLDRRIVAHVKLCVLGLLIERLAEWRCQMTWMRIRDRLRTLQATEYTSSGTVFFRRNRLTDEAADILKRMAIQAPAEFLGLG